VRKIHYSVVCVYVCACVCEFMCMLCVRDMYIQRCRHEPEHTHIHIFIQSLQLLDCFLTPENETFFEISL